MASKPAADPRGDVAVAAELAEAVAEPEQVAERRRPAAAGTACPRTAPGPTARAGAVARASSSTARSMPVGLRAEDALELLDRALEALVGDGGGVGERPAEGDGRHDRLALEHAERSRHQLAGHLPEARAAAREVRRAVGEGDAAGDAARARVEAEGDVALVALGREVHLPDDRAR